jgi:uncharacterized protein YbbC (DUF1343 family)
MYNPKCSPKSNLYSIIGSFIAIFTLSLAAVSGCSREDSPRDAHSPGDAAPAVRVGAERLISDYFHLVEGRRVGIITNHSAVANGQHIVDMLHNHPDVTVTALFGPEHGIRGTADAGEPVDDAIDEQTGIPVYSLYGENRRPTKEMLLNVDVLIFDIQDVGTRFYTYPATMGRAMRSAVEAGIPYVILDRPNPIGGRRIEGHIRKDEFVSGIGLYPTPITHGMTVGELALMIHDQGWHDEIEDLELHVVPMEGWTRDMLWFDTGLQWIPPSPNIPDAETAIVYPGTCLFEGTPASEGRGTYQPFLQIGSPHVDEEAAAAELNRRMLPGLRFDAVTFVPESIPGMSRHPKLEAELVRGVMLQVTEAASVEPVAAGIHLLQVFYDLLPDEKKEVFFHPRGMPVRAGNTMVAQMIREGASAEEIIQSWKDDVDQFAEMRLPYLLY